MSSEETNFTKAKPSMFNENVRLIGIAGRAKSGKSYLAKHIKSKYRNVYIVSLATPLKMALAAIFSYAGYSQKDITEKLNGKLKESQDPILGYTPRFLMQTLGTEWGRNVLGDSWWINLATAKIQKLSEENSDKDIIVIVDDIRFENEIEWIKMNNGKIIALVSDQELRGNLPADMKRVHISEALSIKKLAQEASLIFVDFPKMSPKDIDEALNKHGPDVGLSRYYRAA